MGTRVVARIILRYCAHGPCYCTLQLHPGSRPSDTPVSAPSHPPTCAHAVPPSHLLSCCASRQPTMMRSHPPTCSHALPPTHMFPHLPPVPPHLQAHGTYGSGPHGRYPNPQHYSLPLYSVEVSQRACRQGACAFGVPYRQDDPLGQPRLSWTGPPALIIQPGQDVPSGTFSRLDESSFSKRAVQRMSRSSVGGGGLMGSILPLFFGGARDSVGRSSGNGMMATGELRRTGTGGLGVGLGTGPGDVEEGRVECAGLPAEHVATCPFCGGGRQAGGSVHGGQAGQGQGRVELEGQAVGLQAVGVGLDGGVQQEGEVLRGGEGAGALQPETPAVTGEASVTASTAVDPSEVSVGAAQGPGLGEGGGGARAGEAEHE